MVRVVDKKKVWTWNRRDKAREIRISKDGCLVKFHPNFSISTAAIRGSMLLDARIHFWEIEVSKRLFGTSLMFGVATSSAELDHQEFINLLGCDKHSWGLSHKGLLWHDGAWSRYTAPFRESIPVKIGILFNGIAGTLKYFKNSCDLGVAFYNLPKVCLYPCISSTVANSSMSLEESRIFFGSLQERCRQVIVARIVDRKKLESLPIPIKLLQYLRNGYPDKDRKFVRPQKCPNVLDM